MYLSRNKRYRNNRHTSRYHHNSIGRYHKIIGKELKEEKGEPAGLVLSSLLTLYTAVMSFEILFPFGLWVFEPGWLLDHSRLV